MNNGIHPSLLEASLREKESFTREMVSESPVAPARPHFARARMQVCHPAVATSFMSAGIRKATDDLLEESSTDPNYDKQVALFNSSRAPPKKRLSPLFKRRNADKENKPHQRNVANRSGFQYTSKEFRPINPNNAAKVAAFSYKPNFSTKNNVSSLETQTGAERRATQPPTKTLDHNHEAIKKRQKSPMLHFKSQISPITRPSKMAKRTEPSRRGTVLPSSLPMLRQTSSAFSTAMAPPMLRQTSSAANYYAHHSWQPPHLQLTVSQGQNLIADPLHPTPGSLQLSEPSTSLFFANSKGAAGMGFSNHTTNTDFIPRSLANDHPHFHLIAPGQPTVALPHVGLQFNGYSVVPSNRINPTLLENQSFMNNRKRKTGSESSLPTENAKRDLTQHIPMTDKPCKCANTRCLKLYCECFRSQLFCDERLCRCTGCCNTVSHSQPRGDRDLAIKKILARRPNAFAARVRKRTRNGCGCKKSGCLKKYCECVSLGKMCSTDCTCSQCQNRGQAKPDGQSNDAPVQAPTRDLKQD